MVGKCREGACAHATDVHTIPRADSNCARLGFDLADPHRFMRRCGRSGRARDGEWNAGYRKPGRVLLSDAWTMLIIRDLLHQNMRFCEVESSLEGISSRTLSLKLKRLEEEGIISRLGIYYKLTPKGKKLNKVIKAMEVWGRGN